MAIWGGYFHVDDALLVAEKYENVYLETSAMPYPHKIHEAVRRIGAERVLFASDGPGCNPELEVKKVKWAGLSEKRLSAGHGRKLRSNPRAREEKVGEGYDHRCARSCRQVHLRL
ncbi:amidohydrolase family protein [Cohnella rhizosphaerae]|uniref:amidohydrolase family protein n=1 Tax=Cohnella rhizosphaerae TaxID=1457232 RepID=UPI003B8A6A3B